MQYFEGKVAGAVDTVHNLTPQPADPSSSQLKNKQTWKEQCFLINLRRIQTSTRADHFESLHFTSTGELAHH
jgi:hypothetical protein